MKDLVSRRDVLDAIIHTDCISYDDPFTKRPTEAQRTVDTLRSIKEVPSVKPLVRWIPVEEALPELHDAGILKKLGVERISDTCIITIMIGNDPVVDSNAKLRDTEWYSDFIRFLKAGKKDFKVTAWMPMPAPYEEDTDNG